MAEHSHDFIVFPMRLSMAASKATSYRQRVVARATTLMRFLEQNGLAKHPLLDSNGQPDTSRDLRSSALTEEGAELMKRCVMRWLGAVDRSGNTESTRILERELKKMRADSHPAS